MINKPASIGSITNAMTVDVEDYFQVSAFEHDIDRSTWDNLPHRVEANTHKALDLFAEYHVKATFFTLGWVAERYPQIVRRMADEGHEVASHGYAHQRVTTLSQEAFRQDVARSKGILEDLSGQAVLGYRAPSYSINQNTLWAIDVLADLGFRYSSSIFPGTHDLYGMPEAPRFKYQHEHSGLTEIPVSTLDKLGKRWPCGGGGFFRLYPYALSRWAIDQVNRHEGEATHFYFHPWELDPDQPRQRGASFKSRFRHYLNLDKTEGRLRQLLQDFNWDRMDRTFLTDHQ